MGIPPSCCPTGVGVVGWVVVGLSFWKLQTMGSNCVGLHDEIQSKPFSRPSYYNHPPHLQNVLVDGILEQTSKRVGRVYPSLCDYRVPNTDPTLK
jgi:hypothetical protein